MVMMISVTYLDFSLFLITYLLSITSLSFHIVSMRALSALELTIYAVQSAILIYIVKIKQFYFINRFNNNQLINFNLRKIDHLVQF